MWLKALAAKFDGQGKPFGREEFDQLLGHCQVGIICFYLVVQVLILNARL